MGYNKINFKARNVQIGAFELPLRGGVPQDTQYTALNPQDKCPPPPKISETSKCRTHSISHWIEAKSGVFQGFTKWPGPLLSVELSNVTLREAQYYLE